MTITDDGGAAAARPVGPLQGSLLASVLRLALPAVGTTLLQVLFNITDTFWVGRTLGPAALAGVSSASYSLWIIITTGELLGAGLTAVAARRHGEGRPELAARATGTALVLAAGLGVLIALAGLSGLNPLFHLMDLPADADREARHFLIVQCIGSALIYGYFVVEAAFRSAGNTRTPFVLLAGSVLLNLVLDPLMILGLGPFPAMGVYGAALATVLTRGFGFAAGLVLLIRRGHIRPAFDVTAAWNIVRIGTPVMLAGSLFSVSYILLVPIVGQFGTPALAALGVGHKVEGVSYMIAVGFGLAASTLVGQNLGAGNPARARAAGWLTAVLAIVPIGLLGLVFSLWPTELAEIFTRDEATAGAAALYLLTFAVVQPFIAFEEALFGGLSGAGYTVWPMVWVIALSVVRIPLALWAAPQWGLAGVWLVLAVTAMGRGVAILLLWRWGSWERARA